MAAKGFNIRPINQGRSLQSMTGLQMLKKPMGRSELNQLKSENLSVTGVLDQSQSNNFGEGVKLAQYNASIGEAIKEAPTKATGKKTDLFDKLSYIDPQVSIEEKSGSAAEVITLSRPGEASKEVALLSTAVAGYTDVAPKLAAGGTGKGTKVEEISKNDAKQLIVAEFNKVTTDTSKAGLAADKVLANITNEAVELIKGGNLNPAAFAGKAVSDIIQEAVRELSNGKVSIDAGKVQDALVNALEN